MDTELLIGSISRIVHVGTAITLVGGSIFMAFVLIPSTSAISDEEHDKLRASLMGRWKMFVHIGVLLFLISGFYNYMTMIPKHKGDGLYHGLVGTKVILAMGVFFIGEALVGKSKAFEPMRQNRARWLKILVLLAAVIVGISGFVKVRGTAPPVAEPPVEATEQG